MYIFLSLINIALWFKAFQLLGWLERDNSQGFIYDFQILISGLLAFGAGFFIWYSTHENIKHEKHKTLNVEKAYQLYYSNYARKIEYTICYYHKLLIDGDIVKAQKELNLLPEQFLIDENHIVYFQDQHISTISDLDFSMVLANKVIKGIIDLQNVSNEVPIPEKLTSALKNLETDMGKFKNILKNQST